MGLMDALKKIKNRAEEMFGQAVGAVGHVAGQVAGAVRQALPGANPMGRLPIGQAVHPLAQMQKMPYMTADGRQTWNPAEAPGAFQSQILQQGQANPSQLQAPAINSADYGPYNSSYMGQPMQGMAPASPPSLGAPVQSYLTQPSYLLRRR